MKFLVDANVLSETTRTGPHSGVVRWLEKNEAELAIDAIILGEIRIGILLLPTGRKRIQLERWFDGVVRRVQCLSWNNDTGLVWAELIVRLRKGGRSMPVKDSLIAASALAHNLTLVTRNRGDFEHSGVRMLDPFLS